MRPFSLSIAGLPSIARVATPFLRLAGLRVEPKNHSRHDTRGGYGITPCATGFELVRVADGKQTHVMLFPTGMCPGDTRRRSNERVFACPYRFLGLQLAPGQYLVRHALALPARPPRKPDR